MKVGRSSGLMRDPAKGSNFSSMRDRQDGGGLPGGGIFCGRVTGSHIPGVKPAVTLHRIY